MTSENGTISVVMGAPLQSVWRVLPTAFDTAGIQLTLIDPKKHLMANDPEGILPLANVGGRLGVYAATGPGSDELTQALLAEIRAMRAELSELRQSSSQTARNTAGAPQLVEQFDQVSGGGQRLRVSAPAAGKVTA